MAFHLNGNFPKVVRYSANVFVIVISAAVIVIGVIDTFLRA
jgi:hypothetical protein